MPGLPSFSCERNDRRFVKTDITYAQINEFLHSCPRVVQNTKDREIPATLVGVLVRLVQDQPQRIGREMADGWFVVFLKWNSEYLLARSQEHWLFKLDVAKKRVKGS
jgi:hypothetical protein